MKKVYPHDSMQQVFADIADHVATPIVAVALALIVTIFAVRVLSAVIRF